MKKSILHKKKNENINIQYDLNFEEYNNLAANNFHSSKKVNFKTEANEPLNISINEIEKNNRRNSYQFVYTTNNKNNYTKFGFCPNVQNVNSKKIDYLLDDEVTQLHNKNIYEKILQTNIVKKDKKIKKIKTEVIANKKGYDSDDNLSPIKKRPRNYSFYVSKSTKNLNVYNYLDTDRTNNDNDNGNDINIDNNYNNTSFYYSNQVRNSLKIEEKYSSKTLKVESHLDGEIFNNHSIVFITDKSEPFKKSYSQKIPDDLRFESGNETARDNCRLSLQNNTIENKINSELSELSENSSECQMKDKCLENKQKKENNINDNINKKEIQKDEIIKNNRVIKQKKINHQKEIMKAKNKKMISPIQSKVNTKKYSNNKKKLNKNKDNSNLVDQLLSKEFLISINNRDNNKNGDKNIDKDGYYNFHIQNKMGENLSEKKIEDLKNKLNNSNSSSNGGQGTANPRHHIHKNNISKDRKVNNFQIKYNQQQNGKNIKSNIISLKNGEKEIFFNKINKSNKIKINKSKKGKYKKYNSYNRYNRNCNHNSNKRSNKSNNNSTLSVSQKMSKYTGIKNKTIGDINNNSFNNLNKLKNNFINYNNKNIGEYRDKNEKNNNINYNFHNSFNNNMSNNKIKKNIITINKYNNLNENEKKDLNQNNYKYNGSDEDLKIILNDNPDINNESFKAVRNKQIVNFIYKKKEIREKENENKNKNPVNKLIINGNEKDDFGKNKVKLNENNLNNCESQIISSKKGLNSNIFSENENRNRNRVSLDMPKSINLDKFANGGYEQDKENKNYLFSQSDKQNNEIVKGDIQPNILGNFNFNKNSRIGKLNKFINNIKSEEEEGIILKDDKIEHFITDSPSYFRSLGENKISKDSNNNIGNQKEKEIINQRFLNEKIEINNLKNGVFNDINFNKEIEKEKNNIEKNNNNQFINNIDINSLTFEQGILGNEETIKNNTINESNNSNSDSNNIKELKSEYEFNVNEDKFYTPLYKYENIFNFKKINPFLNLES